MSSCKSCGKAIIFARNESGKVLALEKTYEVYATVYPGPHNEFACKRAKQEVFIAHSLTCLKTKSKKDKNL